MALFAISRFSTDPHSTNMPIWHLIFCLNIIPIGVNNIIEQNFNYITLRQFHGPRKVTKTWITPPFQWPWALTLSSYNICRGCLGMPGTYTYHSKKPGASANKIFWVKITIYIRCPWFPISPPLQGISYINSQKMHHIIWRQFWPKEKNTNYNKISFFI